MGPGEESTSPSLPSQTRVEANLPRLLLLHNNIIEKYAPNLLCVSETALLTMKSEVDAAGTAA